MSSVFRLGNNGERLGASVQKFIPQVCGLGMGHEGEKGKKMLSHSQLLPLNVFATTMDNQDSEDSDVEINH